MSGCSDPTCPSNKPEHFHIENWRLLGVPTVEPGSFLHEEVTRLCSDE